jgi:hypothetical protein
MMSIGTALDAIVSLQESMRPPSAATLVSRILESNGWNTPETVHFLERFIEDRLLEQELEAYIADKLRRNGRPG